MSLRKEMEQRVINPLRERGFQVQHGGKHYKIRDKNGAYIGAVPVTPSDHRGVLNQLMQLRARGIDLSQPVEASGNARTFTQDHPHPDLLARVNATLYYLGYTPGKRGPNPKGGVTKFAEKLVEIAEQDGGDLGASAVPGQVQLTRRLITTTAALSPASVHRIEEATAFFEKEREGKLVVPEPPKLEVAQLSEPIKWDPDEALPTDLWFRVYTAILDSGSTRSDAEELALEVMKLGG